MRFFDLNLKSLKCHTPLLSLKEMAYEHRETSLLSIHGLPLVDFLPKYEFQKCIERYQGKYKIKSFSCWDQFLSLAFAQLTYRESLLDIQACLRGNQQKLYPMGIRGYVSRNTLAKANHVDPVKVAEALRTVRWQSIYGEMYVGMESLYGIKCTFCRPLPMGIIKNGKAVHLTTAPWPGDEMIKKLNTQEGSKGCRMVN